MAGTIAESIYSFLDVNNKLPVEQKECKKKSRGTKDQLLIWQYCPTVRRDTQI